MIKLSIKQILMLHTQLIEQTGGSNGVRDYNLLESAVETPFQSFGGMELYPSIQAKAVRLGYGLIKNHPMIDGNKRIGTHAMLVLLALKESRDMKSCCTGYWNIKIKAGEMNEKFVQRSAVLFYDLFE